MATYTRKFIQPDRDQMFLLPPDVRDWVDDDHLAKWMTRAVEQLQIECFYRIHETEASRGLSPGRPPYDPKMMLTLVFYALASGQTSSRKIERMTYNDLGARYIMANHHPDHSVIAAFRDRHKKNMEEAFARVLLLCHSLGLVDLTKVAIDSTVIKANASQHGAVRVDELEELLEKAKAESARLLEELKSTDEQDLDLHSRKTKRARSRQANYEKALDYIKKTANTEEQPENQSGEPLLTKEEAAQQRRDSAVALGEAIRRCRKAQGISLHVLAKMTGIYFPRLSEYENGMLPRTWPSVILTLTKALGIEPGHLPGLITSENQNIKPSSVQRPQIHPSDLESYVIKRPGKGYFQGFLSQAAVDQKTQIIVAALVSGKNDDHPFLEEALDRIQAILGQDPNQVLADTGYCSDSNIRLAKSRTVDFLCPPAAVREGATRKSELYAEMELRLLEPAGKRDYSKRSGIVEPVFGDMKTNQGFTRFFVRGLAKVTGDWLQRVTVHNLMKLFRYA